ncbi:MAG: HD-GYP domain-containing protein [Gammaproteobacteria bacterium]
MDAITCSCSYTVAAEWSIKLASATHKRHDAYTVLHSRAVGRLASVIGMQMDLSAEVVWLLDLAGLVHDIGKIEVPRYIIEKPGSLTTEEFEIVKTHADAGYRILSELPGPWPIAEIARQHHERLDGSGYPRGLKGPEILLEAQILAVADVTESMLSRRPYRPAHSLDNVMEVIRKLRGDKLNSDAVDACICLFTEKDYMLTSN